MTLDRLKCFFTYTGGKWRIAQHYPAPLHSTIIEPFAGAAGYALHYYKHNVLLYDISPYVFGVWDYLIKASPEDIMRLPIDVVHVDELNVCQEAKWLIGFWLNKGTSSPRKSPSRWMRDRTTPNSFWGQVIQERVSAQSSKIKHWKIFQKSYLDIKDRKATWFIDPPYHMSGKKSYEYSAIDYDLLSAFCYSRSGQTIVCEQSGANWMPFLPFREIKETGGRYRKGKGFEVMWSNHK